MHFLKGKGVNPVKRKVDEALVSSRLAWPDGSGLAKSHDLPDGAHNPAVPFNRKLGNCSCAKKDHILFTCIRQKP